MRKSMKKVLATAAAFALTFSFAAGGVADTASASVTCSKAGKQAGKADIDLDGTYHAYFGFQQQDSWVFRNAWYDPELGLDGKSLVGDATYDQMLTTLDVSDAIPVAGTITDAEITGNGTYRVGVSGLDSSKLVQDTSKIYQIFVSTDIHVLSMNEGCQDMLCVMSKCLAMGMTFEEIIEASTIKPANAFSIKDVDKLYNISEGSYANIALFSIMNGKFGYKDIGGGVLKGDKRIYCELTIKDGEIVWDYNAMAGIDYRKLPRLYSMNFELEDYTPPIQ